MVDSYFTSSPYSTSYGSDVQRSSSTAASLFANPFVQPSGTQSQLGFSSAFTQPTTTTTQTGTVIPRTTSRPSSAITTSAINMPRATSSLPSVLDTKSVSEVLGRNAFVAPPTSSTFTPLSSAFVSGSNVGQNFGNILAANTLAKSPMMSITGSTAFVPNAPQIKPMGVSLGPGVASTASELFAPAFGMSSAFNQPTQTQGFSTAFPTTPTIQTGTDLFTRNWLTDIVQQNKPTTQVTQTAFVQPITSLTQSSSADLSKNFFNTTKVDQTLQASITPIMLGAPKPSMASITGSVVAPEPTTTTLPPVYKPAGLEAPAFYDPLTGLGFSVAPSIVERERMLASTPGIFFDASGKGFSVAPDLLNKIMTKPSEVVQSETPKSPILETTKSFDRTKPEFGMSSMYNIKSEIPAWKGGVPFFEQWKLDWGLPPMWTPPVGKIPASPGEGYIFDTKTGTWKYPTTMSAATSVDAMGRPIKIPSVWDATKTEPPKALTADEQLNKDYWREVWNIDLDKTAKMKPEEFIAASGGPQAIIPYRTTPLKETVTYRTPEREAYNQALMEYYYGPTGRVLAGGKGLTPGEWWKGTMEGVGWGLGKVGEGVSTGAGIATNVIDTITGTKIGSEGAKAIGKGWKSAEMAVLETVGPGATAERYAPSYGVSFEKTASLSAPYMRNMEYKAAGLTPPKTKFIDVLDTFQPAFGLGHRLVDSWNYLTDLEKAEKEYGKKLTDIERADKQAALDYVRWSKTNAPFLENTLTRQKEFEALKKTYVDTYGKYPVDPETGGYLIPMMSKDYAPAQKMSLQLMNMYSTLAPDIQKAQLLVEEGNIKAGARQSVELAKFDVTQSNLPTFWKTRASVLEQGKSPLGLDVMGAVGGLERTGLTALELSIPGKPLLQSLNVGTKAGLGLEVLGLGLGGAYAIGKGYEEQSLRAGTQYKNPLFKEGMPESERYSTMKGGFIPGLLTGTGEALVFGAGFSRDINAMNPLSWQISPVKYGESQLFGSVVKGGELVPKAGKVISFENPFGGPEAASIWRIQVPKADGGFTWMKGSELTPAALKAATQATGAIKAIPYDTKLLNEQTGPLQINPKTGKQFTIEEWQADYMNPATKKPWTPEEWANKWGITQAPVTAGKTMRVLQDMQAKAVLSPEQLAEYQAKLSIADWMYANPKLNNPKFTLDTVENLKAAGLSETQYNALAEQIGKDIKGTSTFLGRYKENFLDQFGLGSNKLSYLYGGLSRGMKEGETPPPGSYMGTHDVDAMTQVAKAKAEQYAKLLNDKSGLTGVKAFAQDGQLAVKGSDGEVYKLFDFHDVTMKELGQAGAKLGYKDLPAIKVEFETPVKGTAMAQQRQMNIIDLAEASTRIGYNPTTGKYEFSFAPSRVNVDFGYSKDEMNLYRLARSDEIRLGIKNPKVDEYKNMLIKKYGEQVIPELTKYEPQQTLFGIAPRGEAAKLVGGMPETPATTITTLLDTLKNKVTTLTGSLTPSGWGKGIPLKDWSKVMEGEGIKTQPTTEENPLLAGQFQLTPSVLSFQPKAGSSMFKSYGEYYTGSSPYVSRLLEMSSLPASEMPSSITPSPSPSPPSPIYNIYYSGGSGYTAPSTYSISMSGSVSPSPSPSPSQSLGRMVSGLPPFLLPAWGLPGSEGKGGQPTGSRVAGVNVNFLRNFFFEKVAMEKPTALRGEVMLSGQPTSMMVGAGKINVGGNLAEALGKNFNKGIVSNTTPFEKKLKKRRVGKF